MNCWRNAFTAALALFASGTVRRPSWLRLLKSSCVPICVDEVADAVMSGVPAVRSSKSLYLNVAYDFGLMTHEASRMAMFCSDSLPEPVVAACVLLKRLLTSLRLEAR